MESVPLGELHYRKNFLRRPLQLQYDVRVIIPSFYQNILHQCRHRKGKILSGKPDGGHGLLAFAISTAVILVHTKRCNSFN